MGWRRLAWLGLLALALGCAPGPAAKSRRAQPGAVYLELWERPEALLLGRWRLPPEPSFSLEHQNSIYLAPVRESFVFRPGAGLVVFEVASPSWGVFEYYGLVPQRPGIARLERVVGEIRLLSGDYRHHRLRLGELVIPLADLARPGRGLTLRAVEEP